MKKLALLLLLLPASACAPPVSPECAYRWVDDSCGKYLVYYQYPQLVPAGQSPGYNNANSNSPTVMPHTVGEQPYSATPVEAQAAGAWSASASPGSYGGR
jgi:hypothetical protein